MLRRRMRPFRANPHKYSRGHPEAREKGMNFLTKRGEFDVQEQSLPPAVARNSQANEGDVRDLFALIGLVANAEGSVGTAQAQIASRFIEMHLPPELHGLARESFREG